MLSLYWLHQKFSVTELRRIETTNKSLMAPSQSCTEYEWVQWSKHASLCRSSLSLSWRIC